MNSSSPESLTFPPQDTFPWKLHKMLDDAEAHGFDGVVSWLPDEKGFKVHQAATFVKQVMPHYFRQTKYKSFQRQLNLWDFQRMREHGPGMGGYRHCSFVRHMPSLCIYMRRKKMKGTGREPKLWEGQSKPSPPVSKRDPEDTFISEGRKLDRIEVEDNSAVVESFVFRPKNMHLDESEEQNRFASECPEDRDGCRMPARNNSYLLPTDDLKYVMAGFAMGEMMYSSSSP
jgi:hypothetical protein